MWLKADGNLLLQGDKKTAFSSLVFILSFTLPFRENLFSVYFPVFCLKKLNKASDKILEGFREYLSGVPYVTNCIRNGAGKS